MTRKSMLLAAIAAGTFSVAFAVEPPHQTSAGSKGAHTPANEGKSTLPVPPPPVASEARATSGAKMSAADKRLATKVIDALNSDESLQGSKITVLAMNGEVTLSGSVPGKPQADKAEAATTKAGAKKVTNSLEATAS